MIRKIKALLILKVMAKKANYNLNIIQIESKKVRFIFYYIIHINYQVRVSFLGPAWAKIPIKLLLLLFSVCVGVYVHRRPGGGAGARVNPLMTKGHEKNLCMDPFLMGLI